MKLQISYILLLLFLLISPNFSQPTGYFKYFSDKNYNPMPIGEAEVGSVYLDFNNTAWVTGKFGISIVNPVFGISCSDTLELIKRGYATLTFPLSDSTVGIFWQDNRGNNQSLLEYSIYSRNIIDSMMWIQQSNQYYKLNEDSIFLAGGRNLYLYNDKSQKLVSDSMFLPNCRIQNICSDLNGYLWVATLYGGLLSLQLNTWIRYDTTNSALETNHVSNVAVDTAGNVWVSTWDDIPPKDNPEGGLYKFDGVTWEQIDMANSDLLNNAIMRMAIDSSNDFWIFSKGLQWYHSETFYRFTSTDYETKSAPRGNILSIQSDYSGNVWFGMLHNGVYAYFPNNDPCCDTCNHPNSPPAIIAIPDTIEIDENQTYKDTISATDPDNDAITFTFKNLPTWGSSTDSILTLTPTANDDSVTITIIASDGKGGADTAEIFFEVIHPTSSSIKRTKNNTNLFTFTIDSQTLTFQKSGLKEIVVLDMQGRQVKVFRQPKSSVLWDGMDLRGRSVPSGSYIVKAVYSEQKRVKSEKIVLMR